MRRTCLLPLVLVLLCLSGAPAARAGDDDPGIDELARMILDGNDAEHALVAAWIEDADRATLRALFARLRALRAAPKSVSSETGSSEKGPTPMRVRRAELQPRGAAKGDEPLLQAEVRIIDVAADQAAAVFGKLRPTPDKTCLVLTDLEAQALLRAVEKSPDAVVVSAPRLTMFSGQKANVTVTTQVAYVKDYDIKKSADGSVAADPVIATIQEGVVIDLKGSIESDGKTILTEFTGTWAVLQRPIGELETELEDGHKVTIQLPELSVVRAKAETSVPDGGWALLGGGRQLGQGDKAVERVALLNIKMVQLDPALLQKAAPGKKR